MHVDEFIDTLSKLSSEEIHAAATAACRSQRSAEDEIAWWNAETTIAAELRKTGRSSAGRWAARRASDAVLSASTFGEKSLPADEVTSVARGASDIARALVAGTAAETHLRYLFEQVGWQQPPITPRLSVATIGHAA